MAYAGTPVIRRQRLWVANAATAIQIDTPAWFRWLQTATSFSYPLGAPTFYRLTVRKEKRRHDWYWYAYLKTDSKLHNAYAGRTHTLSAARLDQVAQTLLQKVQQSTAQTDEKKKNDDQTI